MEVRVTYKWPLQSHGRETVLHSYIAKHTSNFALVILLEQVICLIVGDVVSLVKTFCERSTSYSPQIRSSEDISGHDIGLDVVDKKSRIIQV